MARAK
jgi:hypothetical protein